MSVAVVDLFEMIQIEHQQCGIRLTKALCTGELLFQLCQEMAPIGQAGEWVGGSQAL